MTTGVQLSPSAAPMELASLCEDPLVSVVITSYNYAEFITEALKSVLEQDYAQIEVIVADDGSTDNTSEIVKDFASRDTRVRWKAGVNLGQPRNTNRGFAETSGEIICFLDADDTFRPRKLQAVVKALRESPECGLCLHNVQKVDQRGRPFGPPYPGHIKSGWVLQELLSSGGRCLFPPTSGIAVRREVAERIFPIRTEFRKVGDAYIHFPAAFLSRVCVAPGAYSTYRQHNRNMSWHFNSTLERLVGQLQEFEEVFATNREFVATHLGYEYAESLKITDSHEVVERALSYLLVSGRSEYKGLTMAQLRNDLPSGILKNLWVCLSTLPPPIARYLFLGRQSAVTLTNAVRQALPWQPSRD
ncbi:MAG TPA: glycosyltransferase [Candidatus Saccharimonadales bacterium]|nr:glycosyltransferase [Candidatus Saccharimonadales bacterium]